MTVPIGTRVNSLRDQRLNGRVVGYGTITGGVFRSEHRGLEAPGIHPVYLVALDNPAASEDPFWRFQVVCLDASQVIREVREAES